jgi:23S rRNA G2445 N2-methylase RlmL
MVFFTYDGEPEELLTLRTIEDLFVVLAESKEFPPTYAALRALRERVEQAALDGPVALARRLKPGRGGQGKLRFRVVARMVGQPHFRRVDAQEAVEKGMLARSDRRWALVEEGGLELWLTLTPGAVLLALRLSDETLRHRSYKVEHLAASLRPAAAAAMVRLTKPNDHDIFLDPMCGAGTLLIERALAWRYKKLLGGDEDPEAVATALANIGPRYKPIEVQEWDATSLPIDAGSVRAVAVNLPFGRQIGSPEENRQLYPAFMREMGRVMRPGARLVTLTGDIRALDEALQRERALVPKLFYPVTVLGAPARINVFERV